MREELLLPLVSGQVAELPKGAIVHGMRPISGPNPMIALDVEWPDDGRQPDTTRKPLSPLMAEVVAVASFIQDREV
jgi:hypothetical protein